MVGFFVVVMQRRSLRRIDFFVFLCHMRKPLTEEQKAKNRIYRMAYYEKNKDLELARAKEYQSKNREKLNDYYREYHAKDREKNNEYHRQYRKDNPDKIARIEFESKARNPLKEWAKDQCQKAVRQGLLSRPDKCDRCPTACVPDGHHEDYSRPLDVVWLCHTCHAVADRSRRAKEKATR